MRNLMTLVILVAVLVVITGLLGAALKRLKKAARSTIKARPVLTRNEQPMYFRLCEALPEHIVLCQVAFSALLNAHDRATRNTFDRKVADFVICQKSFDVIAVIELDDSSHKGREGKDSERDKLLTNAGYSVIRYKQIPSAQTIRADVERTSTKTRNDMAVSP